MGELFAGRYELVDPIGRGGGGEVWRAWDHRRRRYAAAKVLLQRDAHALLRFVREPALRIDHPHVLAPTSWAADDEKVLFTMDLVRGGSLAHLIGDYGSLPPRLVGTLLDQLLAGLTAVHAEGVVHRDIKPANLLLEATGRGRPHLRLSDFGISVRSGDARLTETNYVVGTPGYFAPEQLSGAEPDFPQDLYAVGVVAMYMLTGAKPDSEALTASYLAGGFPSAPKGVPHPLWQVVATLLNPDPDGRFRTATGTRKALAAALEVLPDAPAAVDESVEVLDHIGPLPQGFGPDGPVRTEPPRRPQGGNGGGSHAARADGGAQGSMSTTGSFVLAPPERGTPTPTPTPTPPATPTPTPTSAVPQQVHDRQPSVPAHQEPAGRPWATQAPVHQAPHHQGPAPAPVPAQGHVSAAVPGPEPVPPVPGQRTAHTPAQRRPGPPVKVVVPVLFLAAVCFAVGVWALVTA
jgi:serine/threonine-protein kinase